MMSCLTWSEMRLALEVLDLMVVSAQSAPEGCGNKLPYVGRGAGPCDQPYDALALPLRRAALCVLAESMPESSARDVKTIQPRLIALK